MQKRTPHILVVDDDAVTRNVLSEIMMGEGYQVTTASSGQQALSLVRENPQSFDVIILDRMMPELSGLDVLHKLCAIPIARNTPVIMLTSRADQSHVNTAFTFGVYEFIYKPINEMALIKTIRQALKEKSNRVYT